MQSVHFPYAPFSKALVLGFCSGLCLLFSASWFYHHKTLKTDQAAQRKPASVNPDEFNWMQELQLTSPTLVKESNRDRLKKNHIWWVHPRSHVLDYNAGIYLNGDKKVFTEAFPGYPDSAMNDKNLWKDYFRRHFQSSLRIPSLSPNELQIAVSSIGGLDLYEHYGGDIAIFGTSEVLQDIVPAVASKSFPSSKILWLARTATLPPIITAYAKYVGNIQKRFQRPKLKAAVVGYSQFWGFTQSESLKQYAREQSGEMVDFLASKRLFSEGFYGIKGKDIFNAPQWSSLFPLSFDALRSAWKNQEPEVDVFKASNEMELEPGAFINDLGNFAFHPRDLPRIHELDRQSVHDYYVVSGQKKIGCSQLDLAKVQYGEFVDSLLEISERVYVFLTPVTESHKNSMSPCLRAAVKDIIESRKSERVITRIDEAEQYGLSAPDYVYRKNSKYLYMDPHHLGWDGAVRFTGQIFQWVAQNQTNDLL